MSGRTASPARSKTKSSSSGASAPPRVNLSVQDRRQNTRLLNETQRRKAQLLGLTTYDVAAHLHRYTVEPSRVMDDTQTAGPAGSAGRGQGASQAGSTVASAAPTGSSRRPPAQRSGDGRAMPVAAETKNVNTRWQTQYAQHLQHKKGAADPQEGASSTAVQMEEEAELLPLPPKSYDEWMAAGCPTGSWSALLQDEVYAPAAAERAFLAAKYDPKGRGATSQA